MNSRLADQYRAVFLIGDADFARTIGRVCRRHCSAIIADAAYGAASVRNGG
jgi:hypothetical protein